MRRRVMVILLISGTASVVATSLADGCTARDWYDGFTPIGANIELNGLLGLPTEEPMFLPLAQGVLPGSRGYQHAQACAVKVQPLVRSGTIWVWTYNGHNPAKGWPFRTTRWQSCVYIDNRDGTEEKTLVTEDGGPARIEWGWWANLAVYFILTTAFTFGFHMLMVMPVRTRRREATGFPVVPENIDSHLQ